LIDAGRRRSGVADLQIVLVFFAPDFPH